MSVRDAARNIPRAGKDGRSPGPSLASVDSSIAGRAVKSGFWLAGTRFVTQVFSWVVTINVARLLSPEDYGLMAMATVFTGLAAVLGELGLGAAIVQRKEVSAEALASNFWLSVGAGVLLAGFGMALAYPTAWAFGEARVIPITQLASVLFILNALQLVPQSLLVRGVRFREIGFIELAAVVTASLSMLAMARLGFGVWTLVTGTIIQNVASLILLLAVSRWRPHPRFRSHEVKPYLAYGLRVAGSRSFFYVFSVADKVVVGKLFDAQVLGYYSFAQQLASIPTDKIVSIFQQVAFPVFSRFQNDVGRCADFFRRATRYIALVVAPLFGGGMLLGEELILVLLGEKWAPIVPLFQMFCLSQFILAITVLSAVVHNAQGRPHWVLYLQIVNVTVVPISLYVASGYSFYALGVPWVTVFPAICIGWTLLTLHKLRIAWQSYATSLAWPVAGTALMLAGVAAVRRLLAEAGGPFESALVSLGLSVSAGALLYAVYLLVCERKILSELSRLRTASAERLASEAVP
jgi:O-antigen/teichoic acid export membrane protein